MGEVDGVLEAPPEAVDAWTGVVSVGALGVVSAGVLVGVLGSVGADGAGVAPVWCTRTERRRTLEPVGFVF